MQIIEIIKVARNILEALTINGSKAEDVRFIELYQEYEELVEQGCKIAYIVAILSDKYGISERSVYRIIKRLSATAKV